MPPNATLEAMCCLGLTWDILSPWSGIVVLTIFSGSCCLGPYGHGFGDELRVMFRLGLGRSMAEAPVGTEMNLELD